MKRAFLPGVANWISESFPTIRLVLLILMVVLALAMILVVLFQPSSDDGMGAISGQVSDTFYTKNKGRSLEGIMKRLTIVLAICLFVVSVLFFITIVIYPVGA
ncbi:MAG: preprotein translocase subunit SecG [Clostridia bacterium]|jgi:preprotein translocase subunit SecG|nr:preprotein translocase subunit SecG [Clostridia bacterium]